MLKIIGNIKFIFLYYWKNTKKYLILFFLSNIASSILASINSVYLLKITFDAFEKKITFNELCKPIFVILLLNTMMFLFDAWFKNVYKQKCELKIKSIIQKDLFNKAIKIDLNYYDNPKYYTEYILAIGELNQRSGIILQHVGECIYNITGIITISSILFKIDWILLVVVLISVFISFAFDANIAKKNTIKNFESAKYNRKISYIQRIFYLNQYITEIKLLHNNIFLFNEYDDTVENIREVNTRYGKKLVKLNLIRGIIESVLTSYSIYFLLMYKIFVLKSLTIGSFSAVLNSIWRLSDKLSQIVTNVSNIYSDSLYCEKLYKFINMDIEQTLIEDNSEKIPLPLKATEIRLENISFYYTKEKKILNNISLKIEPYKKVAIVGENGAGKSTLVNVILNLYKNYSGKLLINNVDIKNYHNDLLYDYFSCLFQDFNMYATTLGNNVCMDLSENNSEIYIEDALKSSNFEDKLRKLPEGIHTVISNEYDKNGVDFSGGENHKIAMARVIISESKVLFLDEPSSSLDPIGEYNFNKLLMSAFNDRTVIFISHRFFATKLVDKIYMMSEGCIIEEGTHDELMKQKGKYELMYNLQKEKYKLV